MRYLCVLLHQVRSVNFAGKGLCILLVLAAVLLLPASSFAQVVVTQQDFMSIFTPGTRFYINQDGGQFNIGTLGGPQVFDFSSFSLQNPDSSNNYSVGTIPVLAARYPSDAVTFGQTPGDIENNPVFLSRNDSVFVVGQASVVPEYQFVHYRPYELIGKFPTVYGATFTQFLERLDTTYNSGGQVNATDYSTSNEITTIDAYGTLRLATGEYQCIRIRKEHTGYGDKEFIYLTREGVFVDVGEVSASAPDTGVVSGFIMVVRKGSLVSVREQQVLPRGFALGQNFPNPFNPSTEIEFSVPQEEWTTLKVYNLIGQEVATLVQGLVSAGMHTITFDASHLTSGIYFYRLTSGMHTLTNKMVLMK